MRKKLQVLIESNRAEYWQKYALDLKDEKDVLKSELEEKIKRLAVTEQVIDILFEKLEVLVKEIDLWRQAAGIEPLSHNYHDMISMISLYKKKKGAI